MWRIWTWFQRTGRRPCCNQTITSGPPWDQARVPIAVDRTVERPMSESLVGLQLYFNWILQVPSWELTYLLPKHFWRWFSFSQGGICSFLEGIISKTVCIIHRTTCPQLVQLVNHVLVPLHYTVWFLFGTHARKPSTYCLFCLMPPTKTMSIVY